MPLTPTDVANKQFKIAFRGYSLDEVDQFLDDVETELTRLLRNNNDLQLRAGGSAAAPSQDAPAQTAAEAPPVAPAPKPLAGMEGQEAALRTLLLAQRTADEAIAEARAEADQIVTDARTEADSTLTKARSEAESTLAASRGKAASLDADIAAQIQAATGDLDERRRALETRIDELRAFEREYRTRLKAYLETQLRDLGSRQGPDDDGVGVPAGARSSAVGPSAGGAVRGTTPIAPAAPPPTTTSSTTEKDAPALRAVPGAGSSAVGPFSPVPSSGSGTPTDDKDPDRKQ